MLKPEHHSVHKIRKTFGTTLPDSSVNDIFVAEQIKKVKVLIRDFHFFFGRRGENYRLADIMKFVSGKMTDEDFAEMKNPDIKRLLDLDELIDLSDRFFKEAGIQTDLSEYEDAVSSWKEYKEGLPKDTETAGDDELFGQLPPESRADFLEAAYNVDNAVWTVLINELGDSPIRNPCPGARLFFFDCISEVFG